MNWYAYKVLADSYEADRRTQAARHRQAREVARLHRSRRDAAKGPASWSVSGRWASIAARLRRRTNDGTALATPGPTVVAAQTELRPSLPR